MKAGQNYLILNQFNTRSVTPARGRIFDEANRLLAGNTETYSLSITPLNAGNLKQALLRLSRLIELRDDDIIQILEKAAKQPKFLPVTVKEELTQRDLSRLAVRSPLMDGVSFAKRYRRIYPQAHLTGHITGYVSPVTPRERDNEPQWSRLQILEQARLVGICAGKMPRGVPG